MCVCLHYYISRFITCFFHLWNISETWKYTVVYKEPVEKDPTSKNKTSEEEVVSADYEGADQTVLGDDSSLDTIEDEEAAEIDVAIIMFLKKWVWTRLVWFVPNKRHLIFQDYPV